MTKRSLVQIVTANLIVSTSLAYLISYLLWSIPHHANPIVYLSERIGQSMLFSLIMMPQLLIDELPKLFANTTSAREWILVGIFVLPMILLLVVVTCTLLGWITSAKRYVIFSNVALTGFIVSVANVGWIYAQVLP